MNVILGAAIAFGCVAAVAVITKGILPPTASSIATAEINFDGLLCSTTNGRGEDR